MEGSEYMKERRNVTVRHEVYELKSQSFVFSFQLPSGSTYRDGTDVTQTEA